MKKINMNEFMFLFAYIIWQFGYMILNDSMYSIKVNNIFFQLIRIFVACILIFKVCMYDSFQKQKIFKILAIFLIFIVSSILSGNLYSIDLLLFLIAFNKIDIDRFFKVSLIVNCIIFVFIIFSAKIGIIENVAFNRGYGSDIIRYSLGYTYCTYPQIHFLTISMLYFYIRKKNITIFEMFITTLISYYILYETNARTGFYCILIMVFLMFLYKCFERIFYKKIIKIIIVFSPIIICVMCLLLAIFYTEKNQFLYELNIVFSGRLYLSNVAYINDGLTFFGQKVNWIGVGQQSVQNINSQIWFVDCSYLRLMFNDGILLATIILFGLCICLNKNYKEKNTIFIIILLMYLIHSIIEPQLLRFAYSPFIVVLSFLFHKEEKSSNENCCSYSYVQ